MFVKPLGLLFSNIFACFSVFLCCRSLPSKCYKRWKRSKESLSVRLSAKTHDRAHLRSSVWTRIERTAIEHIHIDPGYVHRPSRHRFHCCTMGFMSGYVRSSAPSLSKQHTFSMNMPTCVNFRTYIFLGAF
jgi:hypothetical protein